MNTMSFKGPEQCFSMQVVINMCFLPNPEKKKLESRSVFSLSRKTQKRSTPTHSYFEKITSSSERLGYFNNQLNY